MSFTYVLPIATDVHRLRFKIADTNSAAYWFEDEEIEQLLEEGGSVEGGAIAAIERLLAFKAIRVKRATVNGTSYDDTAQVKALEALLSRLGGDIDTISVSMPALIPSDRGFRR